MRKYATTSAKLIIAMDKLAKTPDPVLPSNHPWKLIDVQTVCDPSKVLHLVWTWELDIESLAQ